MGFFFQKVLPLGNFEEIFSTLSFLLLGLRLRVFTLGGLCCCFKKCNSRSSKRLQNSHRKYREDLFNADKIFGCVLRVHHNVANLLNRTLSEMGFFAFTLSLFASFTIGWLSESIRIIITHVKRMLRLPIINAYDNESSRITYVGLWFTLGVRQKQCDQIRRFIGLWETFQSLRPQLICPNLLILRQFWKGVKIFNFLVKSY